jgi:DNA-binding SARP family transcriptional activator
LVTLRWLGGFALDGPSGAAAPALPKRRAEAVLAVLAVCGDLGCSRERLLALLWPESDEATARHGVRDALHIIRRALGPGAVPSAGRLLRLDPAVVASDVLSFTQALATDRAADAVRLYGGPLLDGFHVDDAVEFERWLDGERARLAREYGEALKRLAAAAERAGAWDEAAGWWARAVEHDPVNSHLVLQQVRVLAGTGDRANAIRVAEGHARRLREEFDLEPTARSSRWWRGSGGASCRPCRRSMSP